jgi:hypothetical protein
MEKPRVIVSSVIRSSHQGESHGGVYLVDFATGAIEQRIDWDDPSISWEGRGADRGLRGIAGQGDLLYLAASDEIFVYDLDFRRVGSIRNRYLKHCHEICVVDGRLLMTSTGFDSVLEYDLVQGAFTRGFTFRFGNLGLASRKLGGRPLPRFRTFDPTSDRGPVPGDSTHINNVVAADGAIHVSGRALGHVLEVRQDRMRSFARIPYGSHNARPFRGGVLMNHTETDRICHVDREGSVLRSFSLPRYDPADLEHASLSRDLARQAFGRGLAVYGDEGAFVGGSSPATVSLYRFDASEPVASINLTMDVRNAVHGLEIWPPR